MKNREQPYEEEAEYYKNGRQKYYYKKVEKVYPQYLELVVALCAIALTLCAATITYEVHQFVKHQMQNAK